MKKSNVVASISMLVLCVALFVPVFSTTFMSYVGSNASAVYMTVCLTLIINISKSLD